MERTYSTPRIDKLGVRPGARVALIGVADPDFLAELAERTREVAHRAAAPDLDLDLDLDLIFLAADSTDDLEILPRLRARIVSAGAIWVVSRKGRGATLRDVEVITAARAAGLVDNKVVSFSPTHTALRLVIPRAQRP
jgi:hypothetical protein